MINMIKSIWEIRPGRYLLIAAAACGTVLIVMLVTGHITIAEMIDLQEKFIEFCPFCM